MSTGAKRAVQERSKRTRDAIIAALDALLLEKSFDAIGVAEIAARAGVSPASIYQRFESRDAAIAILLELYTRSVADWTRANFDAVTKIFESPDLREALRRLAMLAWRQFDELGYVMRPAYLYSRLRPDLLGEDWDARIERSREDFRRLLDAHAGEIARKDRVRAAGMVAYFYNMMFVGVLLHGREHGGKAGRFPSGPEAFARELTDFVCGYLSIPGSEDGAGGKPRAGRARKTRGKKAGGR